MTSLKDRISGEYLGFLANYGIKISISTGILKKPPSKPILAVTSPFAKLKYIVKGRTIYYYLKNLPEMKVNLKTGEALITIKAARNMDFLARAVLFSLYLRDIMLNCFPLHSNLLHKKNVSLLISGRSGGGKSTISKALEENRLFSTYYEDSVYLSAGRENEEITANCFARTISRNGRLLPIRRLIAFPNAIQTGSCPIIPVKTTPKMIIFTDISPQSKTSFFPLSPNETFKELCKNSCFKVLGDQPELRDKQILTFLSLSRKIRAFRMILGPDSKDNPRLIYDLTAEEIKNVLNS